MITIRQVEAIRGADVYGPDHEKIGSAAQIYLDDTSGQPEWVTVKTGLFGMKESFIPLADAEWIGDHLEVPYGKSQVKDAPRVDADGDLHPGEEQQLYAYYGDMRGDIRGDRGDTRDDRGDTSDDLRGTPPLAPSAAAAADVGTREGRRGTVDDHAATGSAQSVRQPGSGDGAVAEVRLRKYVVTEQQQITVPVTREEIRVEGGPVTERDEAPTGPPIAEAERGPALREQPVADTPAADADRTGPTGGRHRDDGRLD